MQPNEQNPIPQNSSEQSTPSNVPDYLHLDPIIDPSIAQKGKKKKKAFFIAAIFILIASAAVGCALWLAGQNTPQEHFYRALENQMSTGRLSRDFTIKTKDSNLIASATVVSDFSNPKAPRSQITYSFPTVRGGASTISRYQNVKSDQIMIDNGQLFTRFSDLSTDLTKQKVVANQWYQILYDGSVDLSDYDLLGFRSTINTPLDVTVQGSVAESARQQLMTLIRTNDIYHIESISADTMNGKSVNKYEVKVDQAKLADLHTVAAKLIGMAAPGTPSTYYTGVTDYEFWIDNNDKIVKIALTNQLDSNTEITFSATTQQGTILAPPDAKRLTK